MKEILHRLKRKLQKLYTKYFTVENYETFILSDKQFVKRLYKIRLGEKLNLRKPITFNEKMNWIKLYDRRPEYTIMSDKYAVKTYVADKIGEKYIIPLIGVWDNADDIDFSKLPDQFVLKCNHNSDVVICTDKSSINEKAIKEKLNKQLKDDYYLHKREWPYKNIPRKIICEKYMNDGSNDTLIDYKFFCFDGEVRVMYITNTVNDELCVDFFDENYNHLPISRLDHPNLPESFDFSKPKGFDQMKSIAAQLSQGIPFVRVDLYSFSGEIYFGEFTFFPTGGFIPFNPREWDSVLGDYITLPKKNRKLK